MQVGAHLSDRFGSGRSCSAGEQATAEPFEPPQDSGRCKLGMRLKALGQRAVLSVEDAAAASRVRRRRTTSQAHGIATGSRNTINCRSMY